MIKLIILAIIAMSSISISQAQNPVIQTAYTADPAPLVYNNRMYLYTGRDEDNSTWFTMHEWRVYSTDDMVNWTDHGAVLSYKEFDWATGDAWASQCIEREGKFYFYVTLTSRETNSPAVGVAVSNTPYGPFIDPLGEPLAQTDRGDIDPGVFIDDDGQAYLYWGNPFLYYVKLNEDMISYSGEIVHVPMTVESFGKREGNVKDRPTLYEEGPWIYKRNNIYYMLWAGGPVPEHIGYSTSNSPIGPWKYRGTLMPTEGGSFTNHPAIIDFKGKTYFFYHNAALPGGSGFTRSVCVEEVTFNSDGTIQPKRMTAGIEKGLKRLNPYVKTEAETIAWSEGVKVKQNDQVGVYITPMNDGSYTKVKGVDFKNKGATKFYARVGTTHGNPFANPPVIITMEVRLNGIDGELLGTVIIPRTGGEHRWEVVTMDVPNVKGVHDLYFVFKGKAKSNIMHFDYWRFVE